MVVGVVGLLAALALPFAPVSVTDTTLTWPATGEPAESTTALVVPYRPDALTAEIPCPALRGGGPAVTVLATAPGDDGLSVTAGSDGAVLGLDGRAVALPTAGDCAVVVHAGADGATVTGAQGFTATLPAPVPRVFGFRTDLDAGQAAGMTVTVRVVTPFATSPTAVKLVLVGLQVCAVAIALALLHGGRRIRLPRIRPRRVWLVDGAVFGVLAGWAVIGPLAVDDGWASMIARNVAATGNAGNYYRWWDAAETPFALSPQVLSWFTEISLAPLWLRLPSTVLGMATWLVLSRGVLGAALPRRAHTAGVRSAGALFLLTAWLPFNLGTRPESYVALGTTAVLALLWRARTPAGLGWAALAAAITATISPTGVLVAAPLVVFAPRIARIVLAGPRRRVVARVALLGSVGALWFSLVFADQTWAGLLTATEWHTSFGPAQPWYEEPDRYADLLSDDQPGSAFKRLPVLLAVAMLPVAAVLGWRRDRGPAQRAALRLAAVVTVALLALAVVPSKWSYHLGAMAGLFAALLTVAVVLVLRDRAASPACAIIATAVLAGAAALAFDGPNAWWQTAAYDVPWASGPFRPGGVPLNNPLLWVGVAGAGAALWAWRCRCRAGVLAAPAVVTLLAAGTAVVVLVGSFVAAPLRRPAGSLAVANMQRLAHGHGCGLADDIEVLPDGPVLVRGDGPDRSDGFTAMAGLHPAAPPPDPPGAGASATLWGSFVEGPETTGSVTTAWYALPPLGPDEGVAASVSGRTDGGNALMFEFGRGVGGDVMSLGTATPTDRVAVDEHPAKPLWRSIGVDAAQVPSDADRVRIQAVDGRTDDFGWLAFTGPRLRSVVALNAFLAGAGPVLLGWPQAFLFPCVRDIAVVRGGVAQTPRTVIESPRPFLASDREPARGGAFVGVVYYGGLHEVPTRLAGHPAIDWGTLLTSPPDMVRDAYTRVDTTEVRWGFERLNRNSPERP